MRGIKSFFSILIMLAVLCCGICFAQEDVLSIVCTSFPCYDFVRAVAGEHAQITLLIRPGAEVHSYEPSPADVMNIAGCDLFVYVGGESDAWALSILDSFGEAAPRTLRFVDSIQTVELEETEGEHEHEHEHDHDHERDHEYDEHIWTSPVNAKRMTEMVRDELCELDEAHQSDYAKNAEQYIEEIEMIDQEIRAIVDKAARKELIFADRFPFLYLTREYDLAYLAAFPSCARESDPSAKTMMQLIDRVVSDQIPAVYIIELSNAKTAQMIAEETGVQILTLHSVQNLSESDFSAGETYVSLMQRNVEALRVGLN